MESARADTLLPKRDSESVLDSGAFPGQGDTPSILPGEWATQQPKGMQGDST